MDSPDISKTIDAVWKIQSPKLIAALARMTRGDVGLAEDLAQDALVSALEQWPDGASANPGAWLMAIAKRRGIDHFRRNKLTDEKHQQVGYEMQRARKTPLLISMRHWMTSWAMTCAIDLHGVPPGALHRGARDVTLKLLAGPRPENRARVSLNRDDDSTAHRPRQASLADKKSRMRCRAAPSSTFGSDRCSSHLPDFQRGLFSDGGRRLDASGVCEDAQRLGRVPAGLAPNEPEVHGLLALMEIQASRSAARVRPKGEPILLLDQDRRRWNQLLIQRGLTALTRAERLRPERGPYTVQAAIAACHARARQADQTDWMRIASLYDELATIMPSPIVELNRSVAYGMAFGPEKGLEIVEPLIGNPSLSEYPYLPGVRADLLFKLKRFDEAKTEFLKAAELTKNASQRALLLQKADNCQRSTS